MEDTKRLVEIDISNVDSFEVKMNKLSSKLINKNGIELSFKKVDEVWDWGKKGSYFTYEITFPYVKTDSDYKYIGTLKKLDSGDNFIVEKFNEDKLLKYKDSEFRCDHCGTIRKRRKVHIFSNGQEEKMVATKCADEYFGFGVNNKINEMIKSFKKVNRISKEYGIVKSEKYDIALAVKLCFETIRFRGEFIPSSAGTSSTKYAVESLYNKMKCPLKINYENEEIEEKVKKCEIDIEDFKEYIRSIKADTNFKHNMKVSVFDSSKKRFGILAYAVYTYFNHLKKTTKDYIEKKSDFVGTVGKKLENIKATCISTGVKSGMYGMYKIVKLRDLKGNELVYFSSSKEKRFAEGKSYTFNCIIKKHNIFKGKKNTLIKNASKIKINKEEDKLSNKLRII